MGLIRKLGDYGQVATPVIGALYAFSKKDWKGCGVLAVMLVVNQIAIDSLKHLTAVTRPNGKLLSFPSGHTAAAFLGAGFIVKRYFKQDTLSLRLLSITSVATAIFVGYSRFYCRAHWVSDIVGGASLGLGIACFTPTI